jgi:hypothetical protein
MAFAPGAQQMDLSTGQTVPPRRRRNRRSGTTPEAAPRAAAESSADTVPNAGQDASDSETDVTVLSSAERRAVAADAPRRARGRHPSRAGHTTRLLSLFPDAQPTDFGVGLKATVS